MDITNEKAKETIEALLEDDAIKLSWSMEAMNEVFDNFNLDGLKQETFVKLFQPLLCYAVSLSTEIEAALAAASTEYIEKLNAMRSMYPMDLDLYDSEKVK